MYRQADPQKQAQWEAELANRTEISPEELLEFFDPQLILEIDAYQREVAQNSVTDLLVAPIPDLSSETQSLLLRNLEVYDDAIEALMDEDHLLEQLYELRKNLGSEESAQALRARRSVVAHYVFSIISNSSRAA
ncbi:hypothetical protein KDA00_05295 [Candidatus Saccharibacteria bacterium]|nr:hypothetical protein [Candidatus Saccharibacteria bacterium]